MTSSGDTNEARVATLYTFEGSVYGSTPRLALIEKGYTIPDECKVVNVDLLNGANFSPEYLRINPNGTVPSLVVPQLESAKDDNKATKYTALTDTVKILEFLDKQRTPDENITSPVLGSSETFGAAPTPARSDAKKPARSLAPGSLAAKARDDDIISLTQSSEGDPNLLLLSARSEQELKAANEGVPGMFVRGRKKALEGYLSEIKSDDSQADNKSKLEKFYNDKVAMSNYIIDCYENPSGSNAADFLAKGQAHYLSVSNILLQLASILPREDRSGFITLSDLHAGAWFARILACTGAKDLKDVDGAFEKLYKTFQREASELVVLKAWWTSMVSRKSFQEIYADGLH